MQMRWRRAALFAAIVIAHVLVVRVLPIGRATSPEPPEQEVWLAAPSLRQPSERPASRYQTSSPGARASARVAVQRQLALPIPAAHQPNPDTAVPSIDWARESAIVAALSRWKLNVKPAPVLPEASSFPWDHSRTHRFEPTAQGLLVNLSDRCAVLINPLALLGGCKVGPLPVHGDLFLHMDEALARREALDH